MVSLEEETTMQPAQIDFDQIKQRMRGAWMAGDFGQIARYSAKFAEEFVDRLPIQPGTRVLDVACGTGNLAIPAARKGAQVWGVDIATNLLEQARQRAQRGNSGVRIQPCLRRSRIKQPVTFRPRGSHRLESRMNRHTPLGAF